jgi:conjugal transfer pilus assembly protein TraV
MIAMRRNFRLPLCAGLAVLLSGCATFGSNVEGSFHCRAPEGSCAPSHIIDARAAGEIRQAENLVNAVHPPRMVAPGDQARTAERTLKIVFPARVDETGTLHDEAVAWAVIENPRWAAELRRKPGSEAAAPLMRQLRRQLKTAQEQAVPTTNPDGAPDSQDDPSQLFTPSPSDDLFPLASPLALPSTAREADAGADAPAAEGFDMPVSPHDRAPRPSASHSELTYPGIEAIEAAKSGAAGSKEPM